MRAGGGHAGTRTGTEPLSPPSPAALKRAYACFPSGVIALCGLQPDGTPQGMAVSAFTPVSLDPALVQVCIQNTSKTWPLLRAMSRLGVSVLAEDQGVVARALAADQRERFAGVDWSASNTGAVFVRGAALWLDTTLEAETAAGDHAICLLQIRSVHAQADVTPLVFHDSRFRALKPDLPVPS